MRSAALSARRAVKTQRPRARSALRRSSSVAPPGLRPRSTPMQARSRERRERILDAAAHVLDDVGYAAASTEAIAERAGTSIGSLYRFFPSKLSVYWALAERHLARARELFERFAASAPELGPAASRLDWRSLFDAAVEGFVAFYQSEPGLMRLWYGAQLSPELWALGKELDRELGGRAEQLLARFAPWVPRPRRVVAASITVETMSALINLAMQEPEATRPQVLAEAKRMVVGYLEPLLEPPTNRPRRRAARARPRSS